MIERISSMHSSYSEATIVTTHEGQLDSRVRTGGSRRVGSRD